ncbi:MAG: SMP-30/gluconolactonase/LRE family protein [Solirubrobacteraceae bacterium]
MTAVVVEVDAHEGPVYVPEEDALYFTSVPAPDVAIKRLSLASGAVSVLRADTNKANGMTLHPDGRLVVCEQGTHVAPARISLVDRATGAAETLVEGWGGLPLNSPNDVVVKGDGTVWFTDPSYGYLQGFRPAPRLGDFVYRHDPATGETTAVAEGFDKPNGLAFSPDERVLYVGDSGEETHRVEAFDVVHGRALAGRRLLAVIDPGYPDGIKVAADGLVHVASSQGVEVFAPDGARVGHIAVPGAVNLAFADPSRIYVTADTAVWTATTPDPSKER